MPDITNVDELLGSNEPTGKHFEGDTQRLSYSEARAQAKDLQEDYGKNIQEREVQSFGKKITLAEFALSPDQEQTVETELLNGMRGLADYSANRYKVGELHILADFFGNGFYKQMEAAKPRHVSCANPKLACLGSIVSTLAFTVGTEEQSLPPNNLGYFPESGSSASNLDSRYVSATSSAYQAICEELPQHMDDAGIEPIRAFFDQAVDRIEKNRPSINGVRIGKQDLPYFANPPSEYFETR